MNVERLLSWGRRRQQGRNLREAQRATTPAARRDARELAAAVGPERIAAEYGADPGAPPSEIADAFASAAYNTEAQREAAAGALEGFRTYAGEDPTD